MKTQLQQREVIKSNVGVEKEFTIKASPAAFSILSSGLYANKILAIVRELSTNAYDAHVAANKKDIPIEIKLPNSLDGSFYVKDFGTGLSHEDILTIYTTYFSSTKDNSNDYVGMLGLGSKSPFSYVSNFIVESRQDGINRIYSCFKNELNLPSITLLSELETEEENGMTIRLTTQSKDHESFRTAARTAFMYFDPKPVIIGQPDFSPYSVKHTLSGTNWKLREADYYSYYKGPRIVQGFISYPIDHNILSQHDISDIVQVLLSTNIDLYVDIGEVDIAASREALSYDPRTIRNLINALDNVATEIQLAIQKQFDECTSEWSACLLLDDLLNNQTNEFKNVVQSFDNVQKFTWNNKPIKTTYTFDPDLLKDAQILSFDLSYDKIRLNLHTTELEPSIRVRKNQRVILDPYYRSRQVYRQYLSNMRGKGINKPQLLVIRPNKKRDMLIDSLPKLLEVMDNPEYLITDPLVSTRPVYNKSIRTQRAKESKLYWKGFRTTSSIYYPKTIYKFSHVCWDHELIDVSEGGIFVSIHNSAISLNGHQFLSFDKFLENCINLDIINSKTKIYGFTEKELKQIKTHNWVNLFDLVRENFKTNYDVYVNSLVFNNLPMINYTTPYNTLLNYMIDEWNRFEHYYDNDFGTFITKLKDIKVAALNIDGKSIGQIVDTLKLDLFSVSLKTKRQQLIDEWQHIISVRYPMLTIIDWPYSIDSITQSNILQLLSTYFNLVDNCNKINDNTLHSL